MPAVKGALVIDGKPYDVPGATVISPGELPWVALQWRDHRARVAADGWCRQGTCHTTQGVWPHKLIAGSPANPIKRAQEIADYWRVSPRGANESGAAHVIVAGKLIVQLGDLARVVCYHATKVNPYSFGVEMAQEPDGTIHEDTIATTVDLFFVAGDALGIPAQTTSRVYKTNAIVERLKYGGENVCGFFGHRDNAWMFPEWYPADKRERLLKSYPHGYADRGRGDPGDAWYARIRARGALAFDIDAGEDLKLWRGVQAALNGCGEKLLVDGVCGPKTVEVLRRRELWNGGVFREAPIP
jgi:hypothetical protein